MILRRLAWAAGISFLFAGISIAQTTSISGEVIGEDGKPLKDAVIKITRTDIKGNYTVKTKKKGDYYYGGLPMGTYTVAVEVNGVQMDFVKGVRTSMATEPKPINFDLAALKRKRDALSAAAASGQISAEQAKELTPEQRAEIEKQVKERQAQLAKDKAVNDAFNAGMQAFDAKQYDVAVESFKKAAEANTMPANLPIILARLAEATTQLAGTKVGAERDAAYNQAIEAWAKVLELSPNDAGYHNNHGLALARAGKLEEAGIELQKAATLDPPNAGKYYFNLGALLVNAGKNEPAAAAFKKAIELQPNYAEAYFQYGNCLMASAKLAPDGKLIPPDGAKEAYEEYLKLAPNGPSAVGAKGMLDAFAAQVQTTYTNPNAPPPKKTTKKK